MDLAWDLAGLSLLPEFAFVRAGAQTRGRGQFGRAWVSGQGNLMATVRLPDGAKRLEGLLSPALALVLAEALNRLGVPARIKWPNDILAENLKIGGILIETRGSVILAGIGINIQTAPEPGPAEKYFHIQAGCLQNFGVNLEPFGLWALFLENIRHRLPGLISDPSRVPEQALPFLAFRGEAVVL
nr:hypothetical protein [Desulfobacula sp.]